MVVQVVFKIIMPLTDQQYLADLTVVVALRRRGQFADAFDAALKLFLEHPNESSVAHEISLLSTDRGNFSDALSASKRAYQLVNRNNVTNVEQHQNIALAYACALMRQGLFLDAWPLWELGRLNASWSPWPGSKYYTGTEQRVDSLLVQSEGGYGDTFMFMRWLRPLKERKGVRRIGLMVWRALENFCDWKSLGVDDLYVIDRDTVPFDWQYAISIMSLPAVFRMQTWADVPPVESLPSLPGAVGTVGTVGTVGAVGVVGTVGAVAVFRLGLCWRAEENGSPVRVKSLPLPAANGIVDRIVNLSGRAVDVFSLSPSMADLYSTQPFDQPEQMEYEPHRMPNWRATAEYLCSMDFVLTVDTAVAHLCGLLGVPALVLLPCSSCWRWGTGGMGTHWYGPQLTVYRQPQPLVWPVEEIFAAVLERIGK